MKKLILACLLLSGCMATQSGLQPSTNYSGYDKARTVSISPHGTVCESMGCIYIGVGAQWNEAKPNDAFLILSTYSSFMNMSSLRLKVDGQEYQTEPAGITDHALTGSLKESSRGFSIPYVLVKEMSEADSVWMRVDTPTGYVDYAIKTGDSDSKAYHALKRFVAAVGH